MQILTELQEELLQQFSELEESSFFYLAGGTALAAQYLHHRYSSDLDLFTPEEKLISYMGDRIKDNLASDLVTVELIRKFQSFCELLVRKGDQECPIHLALDSPFRFEETRESPWGVKIDSLLDLATNKLLALFGRAEPRDFVDVFFLVKEKYSMDELIEKSRQKDPGLDEYYLAIAFHQAEELPDELSRFPVQMVKPLDIREMKKYFIDQALILMDNVKKEGR